MIKSYLCGSVFVQNSFLEPNRLKDQGMQPGAGQKGTSTRMPTREGARERYLGGYHFGLLSVPTPSPVVKHRGLPLESSCQWEYGLSLTNCVG